MQSMASSLLPRYRCSLSAHDMPWVAPGGGGRACYPPALARGTGRWLRRHCAKLVTRCLRQQGTRFTEQCPGQQCNQSAAVLGARHARPSQRCGDRQRWQTSGCADCVRTLQADHAQRVHAGRARGHAEALEVARVVRVLLHSRADEARAAPAGEPVLVTGGIVV